MTMNKVCIFVNSRHSRLGMLARKLQLAEYSLFTASKCTSETLSYENIRFKELLDYRDAEKTLDDIVRSSNVTSVLAFVEKDLADVCEVQKMNLIRSFANACQKVAVYVEEDDLSSLLSSERFEVSIKERVRLAAKAFAYCATVDAKVSSGFADMLHLYDKSVLVVGSGGREHAIVAKLAQSDKVSTIYAIPGNYGTSTEAKCVNVSIKAEDIDAIVQFALKNHVDLIVVGPEQPLVQGLTDLAQQRGLKVFGPSQAASVIESSKAWSKSFMSRHNIPTASYRTCSTFAEAEQYLDTVANRVVVKASGLAGGKGVAVPKTRAEAKQAAQLLLHGGAMGSTGGEIVIEQFIDGFEVSVLVFSDGLSIHGMPPAQDHKRLLDGDLGPNTGGMGAYAPTPLITPSQYQQCIDLMQRAVCGMEQEGKRFVGVLYGGFIFPKAGRGDRWEDEEVTEEAEKLQGGLVPNQPVVLEFNCRFGDPETQVILPLLSSDLYDILVACVDGALATINSNICWGGRNGSSGWWGGRYCCTVVCAAGGYPENPKKGEVVRGLAEAAAALGSAGKVYHAATIGGADGTCLTSGGRVLAVSSEGDSLREAIDQAYQGVDRVSFEGMQCRRDIAVKGLDPPVRIGVLGSTRGTSLQPIIDAIEGGYLNAQIMLIVSNRRDSGILERGRRHNIPTMFIPCKKTHSREEYDQLTLEALRSAGVEVVLLIGYMRILSSILVHAFSGRCLNVHPSLLPLHKGGMDADVHTAVLRAGDKITGCTVHIVTEEVDDGPIVVQMRCDVLVDDTVETLKARVQGLEGAALIEAIGLVKLGPFKPAGISNVVTYRDAGVDIDAGEQLVRHIAPMCKQTRRPGCDADLGGFGGMFDLSLAGYAAEDTVLVSGTDGVGTKLKVVQESGIGAQDIGIDLVAMCVNDVLTTGAEPLFFLDYFATGKLDVDQATQVVSGIARGCQQAGCALIGGETAEMPGMYQAGDFDLAGFSVGAVRRAEILPRGITSGDVCISLHSSGVHSNGFSLVRKCVEKSGLQYSNPAPFDGSQSLAQALLVPTKIYVQELLPLTKRGLVKGMAHITGGGLLDNLPRILPDNIAAHIDIDQAGWQLPAVFRWIQSIAHLPQHELLRTFNCGIGMVVVVAPEHASEVLHLLPHAMRLGCLVPREAGGDAVALHGELK